MVDALEILIKYAIRYQIVVDVFLGVFLFCGSESSTAVALMQAHAIRLIKTLSIGFYEAAFNEGDHTEAITQHLGTEHTELHLSPEKAMAGIHKLPGIYSKLFVDFL